MRSLLVLVGLSLATAASAAKPVTLRRAPADLHDLAARHARGEDVRAPLRATLHAMMPGWYMALKEKTGKPGNKVLLQHESDKGSWLHVSLSDDSTFHGHLFGGGHYTRQAKFNLLSGDRNPIGNSKITRLTFDGRRLVVLLDRSKAGQGYDHGTRFQELALDFDGAGRAQTLQLRNFKSPRNPFGRQKLDAVLPQGTFRTLDAVSLAGAEEPDEYSTQFTN